MMLALDCCEGISSKELCMTHARDCCKDTFLQRYVIDG